LNALAIAAEEPKVQDMEQLGHHLAVKRDKDDHVRGEVPVIFPHTLVVGAAEHHDAKNLSNQDLE
jgi:hypothetical protein